MGEPMPQLLASVAYRNEGESGAARARQGAGRLIRAPPRRCSTKSAGRGGTSTSGVRNPGAPGGPPACSGSTRTSGISHFLLSYVGRQSGHVSRLTVSQGEQDGAEACQLAERFGFAAAGTPVCLDLEGRTYDAAPDASLDYAGGWCQAVRSRGFRPGVYSNPRALIPLHGRASRPDWVWIASWVRHTADSSADPHQASGVADDLWPAAGQRAWQYAGTFGDGSAASVCPAGDTLSGIAAKLHVPGGWQALYKLNEDVIGPNPDVISPGEVLKLP